MKPYHFRLSLLTIAALAVPTFSFGQQPSSSDPAGSPVPAAAKEEPTPVVPVEDFLAQLEAEQKERKETAAGPEIKVPGAPPALTGGAPVPTISAPALTPASDAAPLPVTATGPAQPGDPATTIVDDGSGEGGIWLRGAKLNDVFQFLARLAKLQFFHNADLEGPTFLVTGHLRDGEPVKQMEELGMMYGVTVLVKGGTVYALTAAQTSNLPSKPLQYKLNYLRPTDITAIKTMIQPMLTPGTGYVEFESKTNTLIIVDNEQKVKFVQEILQQMDQPKRQIAIETRILRIKSNARNRVGVDWSTVLGDGMNLSAMENLNALFNLPELDTVSKVVTMTEGFTSTNGTTMNGTAVLVSPNRIPRLGQRSSTPYNFNGTTDSNSQIDSVTTNTENSINNNLVLSPLQINAVLHALHAGGLAQQESSPTLITEDNEQGVISIIDRVPIIVSTVSETSAGQNISEEVRYRIDPEDVTDDPTKTREIGVSVTVTPTILPDETIRMKLRPRSAQIVEFVEARSGNLFPRVNESSVETIARIPDGYSLLIGGFYEETDSDQTNKVPILGDIPGLNFFFKSTDKQKENTSLVFIVTPKLYEPVSVPATLEMTQQLQQRHVLPGDHSWPDRKNPGNNYETNMRWTLGNMFNRFPAHPSRHPLNPEAAINQTGFGPVSADATPVPAEDPATRTAASREESQAAEAQQMEAPPAAKSKSRFSLFGRRRN